MASFDPGSWALVGCDNTSSSPSRIKRTVPSLSDTVGMNRDLSFALSWTCAEKSVHGSTASDISMVLVA